MRLNRFFSLIKTSSIPEQHGLSINCCKVIRCLSQMIEQMIRRMQFPMISLTFVLMTHLGSTRSSPWINGLNLSVNDVGMWRGIVNGSALLILSIITVSSPYWNWHGNQWTNATHSNSVPTSVCNMQPIRMRPTAGDSATISYSKHPRDQRSALFPHGWNWNISGAMYRGVPIFLNVLITDWFPERSWHAPKSPNFTMSLGLSNEVRRIFYKTTLKIDSHDAQFSSVNKQTCGLMSPWKYFVSSWRYFSASKTCLKKKDTCSPENAPPPWAWILSCRFPPAQYSITIHKWPSAALK